MKLFTFDPAWATTKLSEDGSAVVERPANKRHPAMSDAAKSMVVPIRIGFLLSTWSAKSPLPGSSSVKPRAGSSVFSRRECWATKTRLERSAICVVPLRACVR
jgi:hypothetical protein